MINVDIDNMLKVLKDIEGLKDAVKNRITRQAMSAAMKPIVKDAKRVLPKDTGALRLAITRKVKTYRTSGNTVGMVGAKKGFTRVKNGRTRRPNKYLHIIEKRQKILQNLWNRNGNEYVKILTTKIKEGIAKYAKSR